MFKDNFALQETMMSLLWLFPYEQRQSIFRTLSPKGYRHFQEMRKLETDKGRSLKPFDEQKCIFVHITKCAGISIATSLFGNLGGGHLRVPHYQLIFNQREFEDYFKFTFVRNPWDRLVSAFLFLKRGGANKIDRKWAEENLSQFADFDAFVTRWVNRKNVNKWKHFVPQYKFLSNPGSLTPVVDFIGYFECLNDDFIHIQERLNKQTSLQHLNKTVGEKKGYREYYTAATQKIVADVYREDIQLFGYDFDNAHLKRIYSTLKRPFYGLPWEYYRNRATCAVFCLRQINSTHSG